MDKVKQQLIIDGKTTIGIELGSTRIKAVLIGEDFTPLASGIYNWENRCENGVWTYSLDDIKKGLAGCFSALMDYVKRRFCIDLETTGSIGVSAMMHGYFPFDAKGELLTPFRTWRNTITEEAAFKLTDVFNMNIPQRWSIAHLYQAILNGEENVSRIDYLTTLAGYVHWQLTGEKVIGIGDASGMFPISPDTMTYNKGMLDKFAKLTESTSFTQSLVDILPNIVSVGECAGKLSESGARLLDPSGVFKAGVPLCPPEGDAQTGMVATNSIAPKTGNVSAGTSIFAMAVLERELEKVHSQIDIVTTPCGNPVAMVHCNNCTTDLDAWVKLFGACLDMFDVGISRSEIYERLYAASLEADEDCGGLVACNYYSGEHVTGFTTGRPMLLRAPDSEFSIANLMRTLIFTSMATLKIGMDILINEENITLEKIYAQGGLFKVPVVGQRFRAGALGVPVALMKSAGEGGAWGIAVLAAYMLRSDKSESFEDYLENRVFDGMSGEVIEPVEEDCASFALYAQAFKKALAAERAATDDAS